MNITLVEQTVSQQKALLLYFFSDHCAPCISLRPKVQEMVANDFPKMEVLYIDSEKHPEITAHYGIFSNPTIVVFIEGREFQRWSKFVAVTQIGQAVERPYDLIFEE